MKTCLLLLCLCLSVVSPAARARDASFADFNTRAKNGEHLTVIFFGGSLTWGAQATDPVETSYRAVIARHFRKHYPNAHFTFRDAAIGGEGSQLGVFRLERDVLRHKPDLIFLDFTVNDGPYDKPNPDRLAAYESLVWRIVEAGVPLVQVSFALKNDMPPAKVKRPLDALHRAIAEAYQVPFSDTIEPLRAEVTAGKVTPDQLWPIAGDNTHPGDDGYRLYADAVWNTFLEAAKAGTVCRLPGEMIHAPTFRTVLRLELADEKSQPEGWSVGLPNRSAIAHDFVPSRWMDRVVVGGAAESAAPVPLVFKVKAAKVFLFGESTPNSGKLEVRVNGKKTGLLNLGALSAHGNLRYFGAVPGPFSEGETVTLELVPVLEPKQEIRLNSLCVAGKGAEVHPTPSTPNR